MIRAYVGLVDRLSNLLGALGVAVTDDVTATMVSTSNLPLSDIACLNVVAHNQGCSIRYLSGTLGITHPGAVRLIDRLASAGLVERGPGPDRRTVGLHLTAAGRRHWVRQRDARGRLLDAAVGKLTATQRDSAVSVIETLLAAFTTSELRGEQLCRFCDESACPQLQCPATIAATA
jgi:MarR family transcriptional regulator, negative regulator of the multidrug operon emrRAB